VTDKTVDRDATDQKDDDVVETVAVLGRAPRHDLGQYHLPRTEPNEPSSLSVGGSENRARSATLLEMTFACFFVMGGDTGLFKTEEDP